MLEDRQIENPEYSSDAVPVAQRKTSGEPGLSSTAKYPVDKLRVVVVSDAVPDRNGVGTYYADLVEQLAEPLDLAVMLHPDSKQSPAFRFLTLPLPGDSTQRIGMPRPLWLWRSIKRLQPTVIIVPTPGPFGLAGMLIARKLRLPLIVGFHTNLEALADLYWQNFMGELCQRFLTACNRLLFRHASLVLANSPEMVSQAVRKGAHPAALMGTSVPFEFIKTPVKPLPDKVDSVLFAGRLAGEKNLPLVFQAAEQFPQLTFTIAGDGPLRKLVESQASRLDNLHYQGWVDRSDLLSLVDSHQVLLLPSRVESFGTVALEGLARGRLVIVTDSCGIAEWPAMKTALFIVAESDTPGQMLAHICAMDKAQRQQRSERARVCALELNRWNLDTWIQRLQAPDQNHAQTDRIKSEQ